MSDKATYDIVMLFQDKDGNPVWAESALQVLPPRLDDFMAGFEPIKSYDEYSNFFEVTTFNFDLKVKPDDEGVGALSHSSHGNGGSGRTPAAQDAFARWRSAKNDEYKDITFPIEFDTFSFTRIIDGASPAFFRACCNQESFKRAVLVRRVSTGLRGGSERVSQGFLRMEFKDVLLTGINWDDGELVTETVTFICKNFKVRYKRQKEDASLTAETNAEWDQTRNGTSNNRRQN